MKTFIQSTLTIAVLLASASNIHAAAVDTALIVAKSNAEQSAIDNRVSRKYSPEVTLDIVQEIFGHNLDTGDTTLKMLLLAIGMDHTTNESPNFASSIGIPFIVDRGPGYWVERLNTGDHKIEVLVNNALLLLFTKEEIPKAKETAFQLMDAAANQGYWPASFYVAENNLTKYLAVDFSEASPLTDEMKTSSIKIIAEDTMSRYNECAQMGFAPCQFRVGFWLANSEKTLKDGLEVLRLAIKMAMSDTRYFGALDGSIVLAAKEIVFKGKEAGLEYVVREEYTKLIQHQLSALTQEIEQAKESQND